MVGERPNNLNPMFCEKNRLATFRGWTSLIIEPWELARAGFYFKQHRDLVQCAFCKICLNNFEKDDDAVMEHWKWSPRCPLMRGRPTYNEPINRRAFLRSLPVVEHELANSDPFDVFDQ